MVRNGLLNQRTKPVPSAAECKLDSLSSQQPQPPVACEQVLPLWLYGRWPVLHFLSLCDGHGPARTQLGRHRWNIPTTAERDNGSNQALHLGPGPELPPSLRHRPWTAARMGINLPFKTLLLVPLCHSIRGSTLTSTNGCNFLILQFNSYCPITQQKAQNQVTFSPVCAEFQFHCILVNIEAYFF